LVKKNQYRVCISPLRSSQNIHLNVELGLQGLVKIEDPLPKCIYDKY
jgi:hypothetical protein